MARKASEEQELAHRGIHDVIGIALCFAALLIAVALLSYEPHDTESVLVPRNSIPNNWGGIIGAETSRLLFYSIGVSSYIVPVLLFVFGLGYIFRFLSYIRHCWFWAAMLLICCMGLLSTYENEVPFLQNIQHKLNTTSVGGLAGSLFYQYILSNFGKIGATIVLGAFYVISLLYLTSFQLGAACRQWWANRNGIDLEEDEDLSKGPMTTEDLERRKRALERQARKLQEELDKSKEQSKEDKSGLGADLQPVPEPTVRDLSVPQAKSGPRKKSPEPAKPESIPVKEGETISGREIAAATTEDILGKNSVLKPTRTEEAEKQEEPTPSKAETSETEKEETEETEEAETPDETEEESEPATAPVPAARTYPRGKMMPHKPKVIAVAATPKIGNYKLPSIDFLQYPDTSIKPTETKEELMGNARLMQQTLAQFDIDVSLGDITKGPTITRYELHPAPGVKLEKIANLTNNIAAALKAERINVLAPIPGKSSVGVEVPNAVKTKVIMRDLFETDEWKNTKCRIPLALGKDVYGQPIIADLAEMPHLLIAGSTGSGKSVCINSIIASLLYKFSPDKLRFVMIDPKVVELQQYNALPHLVVPVVTDPKKVILALRWVVNEMEKRYQIFARVGVRNIKSFNDRPKNKPVPPPEPELPLESKQDKIGTNSEGFAVQLDQEIVVPREEEIVIPDYLSYIVVIIDELADLMLVAPADVEMAIARITQMARAAGIHCIVATQRPSVDVITGVIKANIPARIAFQVAAKVDSRTILDSMGADKLLGKGDMLYLPPGSAKLIRAQGVLVTDQEIQSIVDFISSEAKPSYEMEIHQQLQKLTNTSSLDMDDNGIDEDEELIQQCIEVIRSEHKASVSLMQRRLRLGYTRAARIMDELENRGIVGPSKGAEPRDILIDLDAQAAGGDEEMPEDDRGTK